MLKRVSHLPGFLALASDGVEEKKCFSELVPLQREGSGACETVFQKGQGREKKLVTEEPKPVGSGRFRERSQDSSWILGTSFSPSFSLRQEPRLGSSSSRIDLTVVLATWYICSRMLREMGN